MEVSSGLVVRTMSGGEARGTQMKDVEVWTRDREEEGDLCTV